MGPPTFAPKVLRTAAMDCWDHSPEAQRALLNQSFAWPNAAAVVGIERSRECGWYRSWSPKKPGRLRAARICVGIAGGHLEFFQRVKRGADCTLERGAQKLIIVVDAIEGMLVWSLRAPFTEPARLSEDRRCAGCAGEDDSGLQAENSAGIAALEWARSAI